MNIQRTLQRGFVGGCIAAILNTIIFFIGQKMNIINDGVLLEGKPLLLRPVIVGSLLPALVAALLLFLLQKYFSNGMRIFTFICFLLFVFFLVNPFLLKGISMDVKVILLAMHAVAGIVIIYFLTRSPERKP